MKQWIEVIRYFSFFFGESMKAVMGVTLAVFLSSAVSIAHGIRTKDSPCFPMFTACAPIPKKKTELWLNPNPKPISSQNKNQPIARIIEGSIL